MDKKSGDVEIDVCICCLNKCPVRSMSERANTGELYTQCIMECFGFDVMVMNIGDRKCVICRTCERQLHDSLHFRRQVERSLCVLEEEAKLTGLNDDIGELSTLINEEESTLPEDVLIPNSNKDEDEEYYLITCGSDVDIEEYLLPNDCDWKCQNMLTLLEYSKIYPFHYDSGKFKCFSCGRDFYEASQIQNHTKEHSITEQKEMIEFLLSKVQDCYIKVDISNLECKLCSYKLPNLQSLKVHLKDVHSKDIDPTYNDNIVPFKLSGATNDCQICENTFDKMTSLILHMNLHFNNYTCEVCGAPFITELSLQAHSKAHKTDSFQCNQCYMIFPTDQKCTHHIDTVHNKDLNNHSSTRCPKCPQHLKSTSNLLKHMETVHNAITVTPSPSTYKCDICTKDFSLHSMLKLHIEQAHTIGVMAYECTACTKKFDSAVTLERHMVEHTEPTDIKCEVCQKPYLMRSELLEHMRTHEMHNLAKAEHTEQTYLKCEVCQKPYLIKSELLEHMTVHEMNNLATAEHTEQTYLKCEVCQKPYLMRSELLEHMRTHEMNNLATEHTEQTYLKCEVCQKPYLMKSELLEHMTVHEMNNLATEEHTERTDLKCEVCQKPYLMRNKLLEHMRTHEMNNFVAEEKSNPVNTNNNVDMEGHSKTYKNDWKYKNILTLLKFSKIYPFHYHYQHAMQCHSSHDPKATVIDIVAGR